MDNTYSNIVTPPDFPTDVFHSVLLIDPEWSEIEDIAFFLKTSDTPFNVYIYRSELPDEKWLTSVLKKVDSIVVNTIQNSNSVNKDKLVIVESTHYYGEKNFLMNKNQIQKPIDYFINYILQQGAVETNGL